MASIQSLGIGSGLLTNELVDDIIATEKEPTENRLNAEQAFVEAKISAYGEVSGAVSAFSSTLQSLSLPSTFESSTADSSNEDSLTATASSVAVAGNYVVEIEALAQGHSLASGSYQSLDETVGNGTLVFRFGTIGYDSEDSYNSFTVNADSSTKAVSINSTNNTLAGIRDAVNSADFGVQATIVDDGSGFRLLFSSDDQGVENALEIVATGDEGIRALNYNLASENTDLNAVLASGSTDITSGAGLDSASKTFELSLNGSAFQVTVSNDPAIDTAEEVVTAVQAAVDTALAANGFEAGDILVSNDNGNLKLESLAAGFETSLEVLAEGSVPQLNGSTALSDGFDFSANNATFTLAIDGNPAQAIVINTATANRADTITAINDALTSEGLNSDVIASLNDDDELVFTRTEAGSAKSIAIGGVDSSGTGASAELGLSADTAVGLDGFGLDTAEGLVKGSTRLSETIRAQDARLSVNGLSVTRDSNLVAGVISGTTLNLRAVSAGPITLSVQKDSEGIVDNIQEFVDAYNDLKTLSDDLTAFDPGAGENGQGSLLIGDSTLRAVTSGINSLLRSAVSGLTGSIRSLSEIGISTNQNNGFQLSFDRVQFQNRFDEAPDAIKGLFANAGSTSDSQIDFVSSNNQTSAASYDIEIEALATVASYSGVPASVLAGTDIVIDDSNDSFSMVLNGISADITLTQGSYATAADLAQQIQLQINSDSTYKNGNHSVSVVFDQSDNSFDLESNVFGSNSNISFTAADSQVANTLGFLLENQGPFQGNQLGGLATANGLGSENFSSVFSLDEETSFQLDIAGISTGLLTIPGSSGSPVSYNTPDDLIAAITAQIDSDGAFLAKPATTFAGEVMVAGTDFSSDTRSITLSIDGGENEVEVIINGDTSTTSFNSETPGTLANTLAAVQDAVDNTVLSGAVTASLDDENRIIFTSVATGADAQLDMVTNGSGAALTASTAVDELGFDFSGSNGNFDLSVDGEDAVSITLDQSSSSAEETRSQLQSSLDAAGLGSRVAATLDDSDNLVLTRTSATGADTTLEISNANATAVAELGLGAASSIGLDGLSLSASTSVGRDATAVSIEYKLNADSGLGRFTFSSDNNGDVIEFDNISSSAATKLGLFIGDGTIETSVAGIDVQGKINGVEANGLGQLLRAGTGNIPAKPGFYLNNAVGNLASSTSNDSFVVVVDGISSSAISLGSISNADTSAVAESLETAINGNPALLAAGVGVTVEFDAASGGFGIISKTTGRTSSVSISTVNGEAGSIFGFSTGIGVRGSAGSNAQGLPDPSAGISVRVTGGALGERGQVSFVRGIADQLDTLLDSFLDTNGLLTNRTASLTQELDGIAEDRVDLDARIEASEARLRSSFLANDLIISSLNTTADFLSSQLRLLEGLVGPSNDE
ncbi:MAG: flagellar filament capping protein FliD [Pseudohongiellaceae bacterium]